MNYCACALDAHALSREVKLYEANMCSIVIRDRLSVIVWRGATLSCRCLEREVSPVASSLLYC